MTTRSSTHTFLESLVAAIKGASAYNSQEQVPPVAVLWPDKDRQWESLLPTLRKQSPVFALGDYSPEENTGPAYWLRCIIAKDNLSPQSSSSRNACALPPWLQPTRTQNAGTLPTRAGTACGVAVPRYPLDSKKRQRLDYKRLSAEQGRRAWNRSWYGHSNKGRTTTITLETGGGAS